MNSIIFYLSEVILLHLVFYIFFKWVLEKENQFTFNRFYLLISSALIFIVPAISFKIGGSVPVLNQVIDATTITLPTLTITGGSSLSSVSQINYGLNTLIIIYLSGVIFLFGKIIFELRHFIKIVSKVSGNKKDNYIIYNTGGELPSCSFLNYIFIDQSEELNEMDYQRILQHEQHHADKKHTLDLLYFEILKIVFWFNPLVWIYKNLIIETNEYSADAGVVQKSGFEAYASLIVNQVFNTTRFQFANYFHSNKTLKRIKKMKNINRKLNYLKVLTVIPLIALMIVIFSCENETSAVFGNDLIKVEEPAASIVAGQVKEHVDRLRLEMVPEDSVYTIVEDQPKPIGGLENFYKYISTNMKYPADAKEAGVEGKVFIQFTILKTGELSDVKVVRGIGKSCDEEAARVIREHPTKWKPGMQDGKNVNVRFILPVSFKLS